jgi:hypothetical protein
VQDASVPKFALQVGSAERAFLSYTESNFTTRLDSDGPLVFAANNAEVGRFDVLGNLGIGTSSPQARLEVSADTDATVSARVSQNNLGSSAIASLRLDTQGNSWSIRSGRNGGYLSFHDAGGERARFDSSGNLGIGTSSPSGRLHISTASGNAEFYHNVTGAGTAARTTYTRGGTVQFYSGLGAWTGGDVYEIASSSAAIFSADANANITAGGGTLATNATNGFLYVPTCAGTPTGTPTAKSGYAPIVVNTTNNKLYFYSGGAWRDAGP